MSTARYIYIYIYLFTQDSQHEGALHRALQSSCIQQLGTVRTEWRRKDSRMLFFIFQKNI